MGKWDRNAALAELTRKGEHTDGTELDARPTGRD